MIQYLVLDWHDPSCNMARYDVLSIEPSLFGETTLTREWGRISWPDQRRIALYENHTVAMEALETWLQREEPSRLRPEGENGRGVLHPCLGRSLRLGAQRRHAQTPQSWL